MINLTRSPGVTMLDFYGIASKKANLNYNYVHNTKTNESVFGVSTSIVPEALYRYCFANQLQPNLGFEGKDAFDRLVKLVEAGDFDQSSIPGFVLESGPAVKHNHDFCVKWSPLDPQKPAEASRGKNHTQPSLF